MTTATQGNSRPYQYREDKLGNAPYVHGPLQPMETPRAPWWRFIMGRG